MKRRIFNLLAALSLLLCAASLVVGILSYRFLFGARFLCGNVPSYRFTCHVELGTVQLMKVRAANGSTDREFTFGVSRSQHDRAFGEEILDFHSSYSSTLNGDIAWRIVTAPVWIVPALAAIAPAAWIVLKKKARIATRTCQTCGYDLRATRERCPECGTAAAHSTRQGVAVT